MPCCTAHGTSLYCRAFLTRSGFQVFDFVPCAVFAIGAWTSAIANERGCVGIRENFEASLLDRVTRMLRITRLVQQTARYELVVLFAVYYTDAVVICGHMMPLQR